MFSGICVPHQLQCGYLRFKWIWPSTSSFLFYHLLQMYNNVDAVGFCGAISVLGTIYEDVIFMFVGKSCHFDGLRVDAGNIKAQHVNTYTVSAVRHKLENHLNYQSGK